MGVSKDLFAGRAFLIFQNAGEHKDEGWESANRQAVKKIGQRSVGLGDVFNYPLSNYSPPVVSVSAGAASWVGKRLSFSNEGVITCLAAFSIFGEENWF